MGQRGACAVYLQAANMGSIPSVPLAAREGCARLGTECALCSSSKKAAEEIKQRELKVSGADSTTGG